MTIDHSARRRPSSRVGENRVEVMRSENVMQKTSDLLRCVYVNDVTPVDFLRIEQGCIQTVRR